jgi:hypothetical protein
MTLLQPLHPQATESKALVTALLLVVAQVAMSFVRGSHPHRHCCHHCLPATLVKEYAQAEGVSSKLGVASELVVDLSCGNGVPEMVEYCEKVLRTSAMPHVDLVPGGNGTGTGLTRADT